MTLLMRDQENVEKGMEKGMRKGIYGAIVMCREFGASDAEIIEKLQEKFHLSREEAAQYVLDSGI